MISVVMSELLRQITERPVLPFNCLTYANDLKVEFDKFEQTYLNDFNSYGIDMSLLKWAISNFTQAASDFNQRLQKIDKTKYH